MPFDKLPDRLPEITGTTLYHPVPVPRPPVYDTEKLIKPLQDLADYMSPYKRALRQAAVAKANAEYRRSLPGGIDDQLWYFKIKSAKYQNELLKTKINSMKDEDHFSGYNGTTGGTAAGDNSAYDAPEYHEVNTDTDDEGRPIPDENDLDLG